MRVLVTRPAAQAAPWVAQLRRAGLDAHALPLIDIAPPPDATAVQQAWERLDGYRAVMFVSPNAVEQFFASRPPGASWPGAVTAASPGPGTDTALHEAGVPEGNRVQPDAAAEQFDSVTLWERLRGRSWDGARVLIVRGDGGRNWLAERLRDAGAQVDFVCAYRRRAPRLDAQQESLLADALARPAQHLWFFSSSEAIDHLEQCCAARGLNPDWPQAHALATHPRIALRARRLGLADVIECRPSMEAVTSAIERSIQSSAP